MRVLDNRKETVQRKDDGTNRGGISKPPPPSLSNLPIQCAVGFEFETGWQVVRQEVMSAGKRGGQIRRHVLNKREKVGRQNHNGFKVEADRAYMGGSELEFIIYPPLDESVEGMMELQRIMSEIQVYGEKLLVHSGKRSFHLDAVTGIPEDHEFVIFPGDSDLEGGPQITSGLDLSMIPFLLSPSSSEAPKELQSTLVYMARVGATVMRNLDRAEYSPELHGLLTMMASYLIAGRGQLGMLAEPYHTYDDLTKANLAVEYPKIIADTLMARTDFGRLFELLPEDEAIRFRNNPQQWLDIVINACGGYKEYDPFESVIERGIQKDIYSDHPSAEEFPLSRLEWIRDIPFGKDRLVGLPGDTSMGYLGKKTEKVGRHSDLDAGIFEFRGAQGNKLPLRRWPSFAMESFRYILALNGKSPNIGIRQGINSDININA
ncbi:hypothetical protein FUAX_17770 [Fulvitalea axinellae]|uniref:Uncharacterized protein n=1 Tax=Fulvitalea axinellae TaxID=1182444 RepID=A0AAU9DAK2_9BACT|nr:hypothetical protein FUAX_17770 [Fulvitalea axinellae]